MARRISGFFVAGTFCFWNLLSKIATVAYVLKSISRNKCFARYFCRNCRRFFLEIFLSEFSLWTSSSDNAIFVHVWRLISRKTDFVQYAGRIWRRIFPGNFSFNIASLNVFVNKCCIWLCFEMSLVKVCFVRYFRRNYPWIILGNFLLKLRFWTDLSKATTFAYVLKSISKDLVLYDICVELRLIFGINFEQKAYFSDTLAKSVGANFRLIFANCRPSFIVNLVFEYTFMKKYNVRLCFNIFFLKI